VELSGAIAAVDLERNIKPWEITGTLVECTDALVLITLVIGTKWRIATLYVRRRSVTITNWEAVKLLITKRESKTWILKEEKHKFIMQFLVYYQC
jgi:hypothetical protein